MAEPNKEITEALTALADKLGTTAEHLWSVMIAARPAVAITNLIGILIGVGLIIFGVKALKLGTKRLSEHDLDDGGMLLTIGGVGMLLVGFVAAVFSISPVIYAVFAPEYSVIREILGVIKN